MTIKVLEDREELGRAAAIHGAEAINNCIRENGKARLIFSTGASQFELFRALARQPVDWSRVEAFHLDEYIDLPVEHIASFRRYLKERFLDAVKLGKMHFVQADGPAGWLQELERELLRAPIDLGFIGIGENAHIAFNDPPADFVTTRPYITVTLDANCKAQQVREGWFATPDDVPKQAISMSVHRIMQCRKIISCVPGAVKAKAIHDTLSSSVTNLVPATKLMEHGDFTLYLDRDSAALLDGDTLAKFA